MYNSQNKESRYKNPIMEKYQVDGQMNIFAYLPEEKKEETPFELCMNPPVYEE